uniref:Ycf34 n=1 Tax=Vertebrata lanosa TaxID=1261582 RepID=A0A0B5VQT7_9FLOR|nr:hypothetical protein [Vertebrata lanosa]AJH65992.1 hypothetical protein [Vertebrata lanosa]
MCICINCKHINVCSVYSFIKEQHCSFFDNDNLISFNPPRTIIHVSINRNRNNTLLDWDLKECASFVEEPGNWLDLSTD